MAEQVAVQQAGPAGATFEERHVKAGEAACHAAKKHRLAGGVVGGGKMADMVVDEIRRRQPQTRPPRTGMERRRDIELEAPRPHRVVIIVAVEPITSFQTAKRFISPSTLPAAA